MDPIIVKVNSLPIDYLGLIIAIVIPLALAIFSHVSSAKAEERANRFTQQRIKEKEHSEIIRACRERCENLYEEFMTLRAIKLRIINTQELHQQTEESLDKEATDSNGKVAAIFIRANLNTEYMNMQKEKAAALLNIYRHAAKIEEILGKMHTSPINQLIEDKISPLSNAQAIPESLSSTFIQEINKIEKIIDELLVKNKAEASK